MTATLGRADTSWPDRTTGPTVVGDVVLDAYALAAAVAPASCHLDVSLLAAIGQVESGNLSGHRLDADHRPVPAVLGPVLDGSHGYAALSDTDGGQWDGDTQWDRAVGPMQFIPSSWRLAGVDLDADGERNPQDVEDAAGAAMVYLCAGGADLSTDSALRTAIFAYNHSSSYVRLVLAWKNAFDTQGLDLAEPPQLELSAVEYERMVTSLDESTARTVRARGLTDDGRGQGSGQTIDEASQQVNAGHKPRPTAYQVPAPVSASASGSPSASAVSASASGPASGPASGTASGTASSPPSAAGESPSPASSPSEPAAGSAPPGAAADAPAKPAQEPANQPPAAQDPAPEPGPKAPPADEPAPAPAADPTPPAEPTCTTPSPSTAPDPAPAADPGAPTGEAATPPDPTPSPAADPCAPPAAEPAPPSEPPAAAVADTPAATTTP